MPSRARARLGNLPHELTGFVGRRAEMQNVQQQLAKSRLVTLIGPGSVGKTRLALRVALWIGAALPDRKSPAG